MCYDEKAEIEKNHIFVWGVKSCFWSEKKTCLATFSPQHIVEGLLNSRRRVSDRPSWILIFKTPATKPTNVIVFCLFPRVRPGLGGSSTSSSIAILLMIIIIISIIIIIIIIVIIIIIIIIICSVLKR